MGREGECRLVYALRPEVRRLTLAPWKRDHHAREFGTDPLLAVCIVEAYDRRRCGHPALVGEVLTRGDEHEGSRLDRDQRTTARVDDAMEAKSPLVDLFYLDRLHEEVCIEVHVEKFGVVHDRYQ